MRALRYSFSEAAASLWRGRGSGVLSTATIALALFVLGAVLVVSGNLQRLAAEWSRAAGLSVYLEDGATAADRGAIETALAVGPLIGGREYVSKDAALARFKQTFPDLATPVDTIGGNPLPASYEVRLQPGVGGEAVRALEARLRGLSGVADVRFDEEWLGRVRAAISLVGGMGLVLGALLSVTAVLTVAAVVRLALQARRDELEIMQLVGAPTAYVKGPFVVEGVLQGGIGALAALLGLAVLFLILRARYLGPLAAALSLPSITFLSAGAMALLVVGGMAVGCAGGWMAAWRR